MCVCVCVCVLSAFCFISVNSHHRINRLQLGISDFLSETAVAFKFSVLSATLEETSIVNCKLNMIIFNLHLTIDVEYKMIDP